MHLIDDHLVYGLTERRVSLPGEIIPDNLPAVAEGIVRIRLPSPDGHAGNRMGIRIKQDSVPVETQPFLRLPRTVEPIAVFCGLDVQAENNHGEYVADAEFRRVGNFGKWFVLAMVKQDQGAGNRLPGIDAELNPVADQPGAEGEDMSCPVADTVFFMGGIQINSIHGLPRLQEHHLQIKAVRYGTKQFFLRCRLLFRAFLKHHIREPAGCPSAGLCFPAACLSEFS